jgi:uncharacterized phage protein (TIGR01671 family)
MRPIKFRGKRIKNGEWVYGDLWQTSDKCFITNDKDIYAEYDDEEVDPETVGQYTGLEDKNGREIYEGDIIRCFILFGQADYDGVYEVCYNALGIGFYLRRIKDNLILRDFDFGDIEIVGNIFDHPDLLKSEVGE